MKFVWTVTLIRAFLATPTFSLATSLHTKLRTIIPEGDNDSADKGISDEALRALQEEAPSCVSQDDLETTPCPFQEGIVPGGDELIVTTTFKVPPSNVDGFRSEMAELVSSIEENEPDTWSFALWLSEDGTYGSTFEQYRDNEAAKGLREEISALTESYGTWTIFGPATEGTKNKFAWPHSSMSNMIRGFREPRRVPDFTRNGNIINIVKATIFDIEIATEFVNRCNQYQTSPDLFGIYQSEDQQYNGWLEFYANNQAATNFIMCGLISCADQMYAENQGGACEATGSCVSGMEPPNLVPKVYMGPPGFFSSAYNVTQTGGGDFGMQPYAYAIPESFVRCTDPYSAQGGGIIGEDQDEESMWMSMSMSYSYRHDF